MIFSSILSDITTRLAPTSDTPALDAAVLIAHLVNKPRTWVMAHPEVTLTTEQKNLLDNSLARLEGGESFPYVLGHWEFFGLDFDVTPAVLIPRPETELLVEKAIAWLQASSKRKTIGDIGTGSGAIAVSIAMNVPDAQILATDISPRALEVARQNARKFHVEKRIEFINCDLLPEQASVDDDLSALDLICANLPYIPTGTLRQLPIFGREPTIALDGGLDGLALYRNLISQAPSWLAAGAKLLLEIEATQGKDVIALARNTFRKAEIHLHKDLSGHDRLLEITVSEN